MKYTLFIALTVALVSVATGCGKKEKKHSGPHHPRRGMLTHQFMQPISPQKEEIAEAGE